MAARSPSNTIRSAGVSSFTYAIIAARTVRPEHSARCDRAGRTTGTIREANA